MKTETKNRWLGWMFAVLLIFNISAGIAFFLHSTAEKESVEQVTAVDFFQQELGLDGTQQNGIGRIRQKFRSVSQPMADRISTLKNQLANELRQPLPDTVKIHQLTDSLGTLQGELFYQIAGRYLEIKEMCTPEQALKLNDSYQFLFGSTQGNRMQNGRANRYRHGQGWRGESR